MAGTTEGWGDQCGLDHEQELLASLGRLVIRFGCVSERAQSHPTHGCPATQVSARHEHTDLSAPATSAQACTGAHIMHSSTHNTPGGLMHDLILVISWHRLRRPVEGGMCVQTLDECAISCTCARAHTHIRTRMHALQDTDARDVL